MDERTGTVSKFNVTVSSDVRSSSNSGELWPVLVTPNPGIRMRTPWFILKRSWIGLDNPAGLRFSKKKTN